MDFRRATDRLFEGLTHSEFSSELGISVAAIRQARLNRSAKAHRAPPPNWRRGALKLAEKQIRKYQRLADLIRADELKEKRSSGTS